MIAESSSRPGAERVAVLADRRQFLKRRWRGIATDGTEFGFDLDARLSDGCVIFQTDGADYLVRQLPERVYEVALSSASEAALIGWKVGNLHLPAQITGDCIRVIHDDAMAQLLQREGWKFSEPEVLFIPMRAMAHAP